MPRRALLLIALAGLPSAALAQSRDSAVTFSPSQEAVLLDANRITDAAERCGFTIDDAKLSAMLASAGIGERDMVVKKRSAALQTMVADDIRSFKADKGKACADALARYGTGDAFGHVLSR